MINILILYIDWFDYFREYRGLTPFFLKNHNNIGVEKAVAAAKKYGAKVIAPKFNNLLHKDNLSSDFNDLHIIEGIKEVKNQFSLKKTIKSFMLRLTQNILAWLLIMRRISFERTKKEIQIATFSITGIPSVLPVKPLILLALQI